MKYHLTNQPAHHWHLPPWVRRLRRQLRPMVVLTTARELVDLIGNLAIAVAMAPVKIATHLYYRRRHITLRSTSVPTRAGLGLAALGLIFALFLPILVTRFSPFAPTNELRFKRSWLSGYQVEATSPKGDITTKLGTTKDGMKLRVERPGVRLDYQMPVPGLDLTVAKDTAIYQNTQQAITIDYQLVDNGIKESLVLQADPLTNKFTSTFETQGLIPYLTPEQQLVFYDEAGNYQFHFETPYAFDSAGNTTYGVKYKVEAIEDIKKGATSLVSPLVIPAEDNSSTPTTMGNVTKNLLGSARPVTRTLQTSTYRLTLTVDPLWLNNPARVYPLTIDPTIIHDTSTEFAAGQLNRVVDVGSGSSPQLTSYYQPLPADESTIALWHMDDAGFSIADSSGNAYIGTAFNTSVVTGFFNNARSFNGSSSYVTLSNSSQANIAGEISVEAWINPTLATTSTIVHKNVQYSIRINTDGTVTWADSSNWSYANFGNHNIGIVANEWQHIAVTKSSNVVVIYLNGQEKLRKIFGGPLTTGAGITHIGCYGLNTTSSCSASTYFTGTIDEIRLSSRARSAEEIKLAASRRPYSVYTSEVIDLETIPPGWGDTVGGETLYDDTGLVAQWNFNETSGTTAAVAAGSCGATCNGTLTNMVTSGQDASYTSGWTANNARLGGGAVMFDGSNDYVNISSYNGIGGANERSVEAWVNSSYFADQAIISWGEDTAGNKYVVRADAANGGVLRVEVGGGNKRGTTNILDGKWHYVVVTLPSGSTDVSDHKLYVDGKEEATLVNAQTINTSTTQAVRIGQDHHDRYWKGMLDSVRIYERELTPTEIEANYSSADFQWQEFGVATGDGETPYSTQNLVAQWNLNETSGTTATNDLGSCGSSCNGTLTSFSFTSSQDVAPGDGWTAVNKRWGAGALMFDGANNYVNIGDVTNFDGATEMTIETWINPHRLPSGTDINSIVAKADYSAVANNAYFIRLRGTEGIRAAFSDGTNQVVCNNTTTAFPEIGKWNHIVAVLRPDDTCEVYLNGRLVNSGSNTSFTSIANTSTTLRLGGSNFASELYFDGTMDVTRMYTRALPAHEIMSNYNTGTIEFQTRTSADGATWEAWTPTSSETAVNSFDSDETNWSLTTDPLNFQINKYNNITATDCNTGVACDGNGKVGLGEVGSGTKGDDVHVAPFTVLNDGGTYKMWYSGHDGSKWRTYYATSPDGLTWTKLNNTTATDCDAGAACEGNGKVGTGTGGTGDVNGVYSPSVIKDGSTYKMWYSGSDSTNWRIFYATSSDGLTWTKYNNTPTGTACDYDVNSGDCEGNGIVGLGGSGRGDALHIYSPTVIKEGSTYKMWYQGADSGGSTRMYYATSSDGLTWTKLNNVTASNCDAGAACEGNGKLGLGSSGKADDAHAYQARVVPYDNGYLMFYGAHDGTYVRRSMAISTDGLTWNKLYNTVVPDSDSSSPYGTMGRGSGTTGKGDGFHIISNAILYENNHYKIWYGGYGGTTGGYRGYLARMVTDPSLLGKSDESILKIEGSGSMKLQTGRQEVDDYTVALYHLDETNGDNAGVDIFDATANNLDGEINGTTVTEGVIGKARSFNGTSDNIIVSDDVLLKPGAITLSAWIKTTTDARHILSKYNGSSPFQGYGLLVGSSKFACWVGGSAWTYSTTTITDGQWHYVTCTYDGTNVKVYVNGNLETTQAQSGTLSHAVDLHIGERVDGTTRFAGTIDELKIDSTVRSAQEIAESYRMGRDHILSKTISSTDLSGKTHLPFQIAADRPGTYLEATIGESAYANGETDANTVGYWKMDEEVVNWGDKFSGSTIDTTKWVEIDASSKITQNNGLVLSAGAAAAWDSALIANKTFAREGNLQLYATFTSGASLTDHHFMVGWGQDQTSNPSYTTITHALYFTAAGQIHGYQDGSSLGYLGVNYTTNTKYEIRITLSPTTAKYEMRSGATAGADSWITLLEADTAKTTAALRPQISQYRSTATIHQIAVTSGNENLIKDSSGTGKHIQNVNAASTEGYLGKAYAFDGVSDSMIIPTSEDMNFGQGDSFTIEAWVNPAATGASQQIFAKQRNTTNEFVISLFISSGNFITFTVAKQNVGTTSIASAPAITTNRWYHIVGVSDGSTIYLYVDGTLKSTGTISISGATQSLADATIGQSYNSASTFNGTIDEVRLSNVARTADEIRQAYEIKKRTHPITIDFAARLLDDDAACNDDATSTFEINATEYGLSQKASNLYLGDTIVIREEWGGVEFIDQGTVTSVNQSTGIVTVAWQDGSLDANGCYSDKSQIFKWQREYFDLTGLYDPHINATTRLTVRVTNGSEGRTIWLDDMKSTGGYMSDPLGSVIDSTVNRYFQYRAILSSSDPAVSPWLEEVTVSYETNIPPSAPTDLWTEGTTNPTDVIDLTPEFSAVYNDSNDGDTANYYQIEVNTHADFTGTVMWNSGQTSMTATTEGTRSPDISYAGTALNLNGKTYYWRIKFWDNAGDEGAWSTESASFTMANIASPTSCTLVRARDNSQITINWNDPNTLEDGYEIQKNTNGGGFSTLITTAADVVTHDDTDISNGSTYQYRVRATHPVQNSDWCTTATLSPDNGSLHLEGINLEGLTVD